MNHFIVILATGFGVGYVPLAPGTLGTLLSIPIYYYLSEIPFPLYEITLTGFFFLAVWVSEKTGSLFGKKDDQRIVIDEMMGFFITMLWIPKTTLFVILGFLLFRFFDIVKPPPIRLVEKARGGYGVLLDDGIAGVYANLLLQLFRSIYP